jgi:hypothetical protein
MVLPPLFSISLFMTIPIALTRNLQPQRLTVGHRDPENPRRGFELINAVACWRLVNPDGRATSSLRANGSRECAPDDRLREAIQSGKKNWIASSLRSSQRRRWRHSRQKTHKNA